jgi:hypothetical protein
MPTPPPTSDDSVGVIGLPLLHKVLGQQHVLLPSSEGWLMQLQCSALGTLCGGQGVQGQWWALCGGGVWILVLVV